MPTRETVYVCRAKNGELFTASEELANVVETFDAVRPGFQPQNGLYRIVYVNMKTLRAGTFTDASGERWRILAYPEGGWSTERFVEAIGWVETGEMPEDIGQAICHAMGLAWVSDWTPEEILAREG